MDRPAKAAVIGAGPAGLMAAEILLENVGIALKSVPGD